MLQRSAPSGSSAPAKQQVGQLLATGARGTNVAEEVEAGRGLAPGLMGVRNFIRPGVLP
jgi:hypothetical protein